jgi:hypothetical protein
MDPVEIRGKWTEEDLRQMVDRSPLFRYVV